MTDKQLYRLCKKYGRRVLEARRKFAGLLPEVLRRKLYEKKGFGSIYEFAARLAGLSRDHVDTVLRLERRFEDKPALHQALVSGEISPNKLIRIACIATTQNQQELFETAQKLSKQAIDVFVKDYRVQEISKPGENDGTENGQQRVESGAKNEIQNGLFKPENTQNSLPGQTCNPSFETIAPANFDYEIVNTLSPEVKKKLKELIDKGIDINNELMEFFKERECQIALEKKQIAQEMGVKQKQLITVTTASPSRYISAKIKKIIKKEYGNKCAKPDCLRPAENLHHTHRFALTKSHNPYHLRPLCMAHHEIEHMSDPGYQCYRSKFGDWR